MQKYSTHIATAFCYIVQLNASIDKTLSGIDMALQGNFLASLSIFA
jgi:hypothetical protein